SENTNGDFFAMQMMMNIIQLAKAMMNSMSSRHPAGFKADARKQDIRFDHAFHRWTGLLGVALLERGCAKFKDRIAAETCHFISKTDALHFHAVESARLAAGVRFIEGCKCITDTSSEEACRSLCDQRCIHQNQVRVSWQKRILSHRTILSIDRVK